MMFLFWSSYIEQEVTGESTPVASCSFISFSIPDIQKYTSRVSILRVSAQNKRGDIAVAHLLFYATPLEVKGLA